MSIERAKGCFHCQSNDQNAGICSKGCEAAAGFKLFGVQIDPPTNNIGGDFIRKTKSFENLQSCNSDCAIEPSSGYMSDGFIQQSSSRSRKKGRPWTEEEHRSFLHGLEKLGKGNWKGIAVKYVPTRNSSQVASHAQKYFIRKAAAEKKKRRRSSVFDIKQSWQEGISSLRQPNKEGSKTAESSTSRATRLKNSQEANGCVDEDSRVAHARACERPPLAPMKKPGISNLQNIIYTPRLVLPQTVMPSVSWVPVIKYPGHRGIYLPEALVAYSTNPSGAVLEHKGSRSKSAHQMMSVPSDRTSNVEVKINIGDLTL